MCDLRNIVAIRLDDGTIERYDSGVPAAYFSAEFAKEQNELSVSEVTKPGLYRCSAAPCCGAGFRYFDGSSWIEEGSGWKVKELLIEESACNTAFQMMIHHGLKCEHVEIDDYSQLPEKYTIRVVMKDE
jgi:hypothetical protein